MTPPETEARAALFTALQSVFPAIDIRNDRLHASLGDTAPVIGVYPDETPANPREKFVNEMRIIVQFFEKYEKIVDRQQTVDPAKIEKSAEEFRKMIKSVDPKTSGVWYFELTRIQYPPDPTGNITRFVAQVTARGNNTALLETH